MKNLINELLFFKEKLYNGIFGNRVGCFDEAIKVCKELEQYRAIGTVEEFKSLVENHHFDCKECAGCTAWNCDCANTRARAIDEFVEALANKVVLKYGNATPAEQYVAMQVTDWAKEIAEQLKK